MEPIPVRAKDIFVCSMIDPPAIPHGAGAVPKMCCIPTVCIAGSAAATAGCVIPCASATPNFIATGSVTVLIGGAPAARITDKCAHAPTILFSTCTNVLIGD